MSGSDEVGPTSRVADRMMVNSFGNAAPILVAVVTAPLLAHTLGVAARGQVAAATGPFLLASACATLGLPDALTFFLARRVVDLRRSITACMILMFASSLGVGGIIVGLAPTLSNGIPSVTRLIIIGGVAVVPSLSVTALRGAAAGLHEWSSVRRERVIGALARLVGLVGLASVGHLTVLGATIVIAFSPTVGGISYLRLLRKAEYDVPESGNADFRYVREFSLYGVRVWLGAVSGILLARLDQAIMNPLSGSHELGLYSVAVSVGELPLIVSTAMREVMFSEQSKDADTGQLGRAARVSFLLCGAFGIAILASMPAWFTLAFGSDFRPAEVSTVILVVAVVIGTPGSIAGSGLSGRGTPGKRSLGLVIACIVNIALLFLLVPSFGSVGAAWATLGGNVIATGLAVWFMCRAANMRFRDFYRITMNDVVYVVDRLPIGRVGRRRRCRVHQTVQSQRS